MSSRERNSISTAIAIFASGSRQMYLEFTISRLRFRIIMFKPPSRVQLPHPLLRQRVGSLKEEMARLLALRAQPEGARGACPERSRGKLWWTAPWSAGSTPSNWSGCWDCPRGRSIPPCGMPPDIVSSPIRLPDSETRAGADLRGGTQRQVLPGQDCRAARLLRRPVVGADEGGGRAQVHPGPVRHLRRGRRQQGHRAALLHRLLALRGHDGVLLRVGPGRRADPAPAYATARGG